MHCQIKVHQCLSMMSFCGWGLKVSVRVGVNFENGVVTLPENS